MDEIRSRARRGRPEPNDEAVKSLLQDDRMRRLEAKLSEDREARIKLEALVSLQQQTIEFLRERLEGGLGTVAVSLVPTLADFTQVGEDDLRYVSPGEYRFSLA